MKFSSTPLRDRKHVTPLIVQRLKEVFSLAHSFGYSAVEAKRIAVRTIEAKQQKGEGGYQEQLLRIKNRTTNGGKETVETYNRLVKSHKKQPPMTTSNLTHPEFRDQLGRLPPYLLAEITDHRFDTQAGPAVRTVELISYSYPTRVEEGPAIGFERELVQVRLVPGDCNTLREIATDCLRRLRAVPKRGLWLHYARTYGLSSFPADMLRYDSCQVHPESDDLFEHNERYDDYRVMDKVGPLEDDRQIVIVQVSESAKPRWTHARWNSFNWSVKPGQTIKLGDKE